MIDHLFRIILFLSHLLLLCYGGGAGWDTPNIVIQHGQWEQIPNDYYDRSKTPQPPLPYDDKYLQNDTSIIVLIASFRETRCKDTLYNLFTKASHPDRVFMAIIQQNRESEDEDCVYAYCQRMNPNANIANNSQWNNNNCKYYDNIKIQRLKDTDAKGPVYARALQV